MPFNFLCIPFQTEKTILYEILLNFSCHRCQAFFHDTKKMREHLRSHPKDPSLSVCPTCGKKFYYYKNLHFHMLSHLPIELQPQFECYLCKKPSKSHQSLQKHIKFHVGSKFFPFDSKLSIFLKMKFT